MMPRRRIGLLICSWGTRWHPGKSSSRPTPRLFETWTSENPQTAHPRSGWAVCVSWLCYESRTIFPYNIGTIFGYDRSKIDDGLKNCLSPACPDGRVHHLGTLEQRVECPASGRGFGLPDRGRGCIDRRVLPGQPVVENPFPARILLTHAGLQWDL